MAKETYNKIGRCELDYLSLQRPTYMAKETHIYGKRDLNIWKKRPKYMEKET